jgi:zinc protease
MRVHPGPFTAGAETKNESAHEVTAIIADEIGRLATTDTPSSELVPRKAVLIGEFAQSLERSAGIVDQLSALALNDVPLTDINRYIQGVEGVSAAEVRETAKSAMSGTHVVIVGDASKFIGPLREKYPDVEVIAIESLDLTSPALRIRKEKE